MTAVARASGNYELQVSVPYQQTRNCLKIIQVLPWVPDVRLVPRQTERMTVRRTITLTLSFRFRKDKTHKRVLELSPYCYSCLHYFFTSIIIAAGS
jgi:hypothetical protein